MYPNKTERKDVACSNVALYRHSGTTAPISIKQRNSLLACQGVFCFKGLKSESSETSQTLIANGDFT